MDTFFTLLKKGLVATVFAVFAFVATYIPQPFNQVNTVEAGGLGGGATEWTQIANNVQLAGVNVATTASAGFNSAVAWATGSLWVKENILDGIGWAIAKRIVSSMVQSLINWINSGFQGSPMFIQDLKGFLLNVADEAIGEYISELGGIGSFICSPFKLDVQISVALQYQQARSNGGNGQPAPTCTLSGIIDNLEGFISGTFSEGGWNDWFTITATPQTYTPYGSMLSAQAGARARLINAQGEEIKLLDWGDGFMSGKICDVVHGAGAPKKDCFISKPGKIIEEALSFNLDSGRQSLITADEINEVIAALLGQLANKAIQGINGLLGLSAGTGYTYSGYGDSYLDAMVASSSELVNTGAARDIMVEALTVQQEFNALATIYEPQLVNYTTNPTNNAARRTIASSSAADAREIIAKTESYIASTTQIIIRMDAAVLEADHNTQAELITEFNQLTLYSRHEMEATEAEWETVLR